MVMTVDEMRSAIEQIEQVAGGEDAPAAMKFMLRFTLRIKHSMPLLLGLRCTSRLRPKQPQSRSGRS